MEKEEDKKIMGGPVEPGFMFGGGCYRDGFGVFTPTKPGKIVLRPPAGQVEITITVNPDLGPEETERRIRHELKNRIVKHG